MMKAVFLDTYKMQRGGLCMKLLKKRTLFVILVLFGGFLFLAAETSQSPEIEMVLTNVKEINSGGDDFYPSITADGTIMVFGIKPVNSENSDIFISYFKDGLWTTPMPIKEINTTYDEQTPFISHDGMILLFSSNREGTSRPPKTKAPVYYLTNDIYISYWQGERWSEPQRLLGEVNTIDNERAPSLSNDGKTLYFSRYEGNDIYSSKIYSATIDGILTSNVQLMPAPINSDYSDFGLMPSRSKPGFYFSSNRPGGYGLWDIYFVSFVNNEFGEPINLGSPINSENNDLSITELGDKIYFCSDRKGGVGNSDVYAIILSKKVIQIPETGFIFSLIDKKNKQAVRTSLDVAIYPTQQKDPNKITRLQITSDETGTCQLKTDCNVPKIDVRVADERYKTLELAFNVKPGEMQQVTIELEEIEKKEEPKVQLQQVQETQVQEVQIQKPIQEQESPAQQLDIDIRPIYFEYSSTNLLKKEMQYIAELVNRLNQVSPLCITIVGHTDPKGSDGYNKTLGLVRAVAVWNALEKYGLKAKYSILSLGEQEPSELYRKTGEQKYNRRVEIMINNCKNSKK